MTSRFRHFAKAMLMGFAAWAAGAGFAGSAARADFVVFDPDGAAAANGNVSVSNFDNGPGNLLAQGLVTAENNFLSGTGSTTFQVYYQATVAALSPGTPVAPNTNPVTGLGSTFELTQVASFTAQVNSITPSTSPLSPTASVTFSVAATQSPNSYFKMFFNANPNPGTQPPTAASWPTRANNLSGTGFTDGTLILSATPVRLSSSDTGNFQPTGSNSLFDSFGPDNYGGKQSITVSNGGAVFNANEIFADPAFFKTVPTSFNFNTLLRLPFTATDPSQRFSSSLGSADIVPNIPGANGTSGTDIQFQTDANVNPVNPVPEPASITLLGMGLAGAFGYGWRKRFRTA